MELQDETMTSAVCMFSTPCPLLPQKRCTPHGVQGSRSLIGFLAHWEVPNGLSKDSICLAYYVSLSRPRGLVRLLSHGLPDRDMDIIEGGPPKSITQAFEDFFETIVATKVAWARFRVEMGWPARVD